MFAEIRPELLLPWRTVEWLRESWWNPQILNFSIWFSTKTGCQCYFKATITKLCLKRGYFSRVLAVHGETVDSDVNSWRKTELSGVKLVHESPGWILEWWPWSSFGHRWSQGASIQVDKRDNGAMKTLIFKCWLYKTMNKHKHRHFFFELSKDP